jgi:hypothetical protein
MSRSALPHREEGATRAERSENGQIETHQATGRLACSCRMPIGDR